jgi:hypothetical protein
MSCGNSKAARSIPCAGQEFHDLQSDLTEHTNLSNSERHSSTVKAMLGQLVRVAAMAISEQRKGSRSVQ